jgi:hypothetical protein
MAKIVADKLVVGLIVVVVGYLVSRQLERFKQRQGYVSSINNRRVEALGEVLAKVADYEFTLYQTALLGAEAVSASPDPYRAAVRECASPVEMTNVLISMRKELSDAGGASPRLLTVSDELLEAIARSRAKHALADEAINKNRFWIGRAFYLHILDQVKQWPQFLECIKTGDRDSAGALYRKTIAEMMDVFTFMHEDSRQGSFRQDNDGR